MDFFYLFTYFPLQEVCLMRKTHQTLETHVYRLKLFSKENSSKAQICLTVIAFCC